MRNDFSFYGLIVEMTPKLIALAQPNFENNLVELVLSERLNDRLQALLNEMLDIQNVRFDEKRF